jgi:hypothetical protein
MSLIPKTKTPHNHGTPLTQSPIQEPCPACLGGVSGGNPESTTEINNNPFADGMLKNKKTAF